MTARFRYALDPLCLLACACYAAVRFLWKPHSESWFIRGQWTDLLLIPCALPIVLWIQRQLGLRRHDHPPCRAEIILHLLVWSIAAEWFAPLFFAVTADPLDLVAYATGAALSWRWWSFSPGSAPSSHGSAPE